MLPLALPEGDACYDDKADIAELNGLQESSDFVLRPDQPPTNEMMAFLRLINISGDNIYDNPCPTCIGMYCTVQEDTRMLVYVLVLYLLE